ncbi:HECT-type E3 ubiquitin transferase [Malassezia vespertilionis]|uniref:HECT-type E3 ubiquitin transferase n=1 Tax=Malassezia vespertilionis TaxID=2020962 RepID=UPI0024B1C0B7|nr:HECT-type E3 ubiquitin transferase [Malassezia vespertilionis]WFD06938.1 HECT-type E3 ubiquitin transferase [Malassezia vespertilionis]
MEPGAAESALLCAVQEEQVRGWENTRNVQDIDVAIMTLRAPLEAEEHERAAAREALAFLLARDLTTRNVLTMVRTVLPLLLEQDTALAMRVIETALAARAATRIPESEGAHAALVQALHAGLGAPRADVRSRVVSMLPQVHALWPQMPLGALQDALESCGTDSDASVRAAAEKTLGALAPTLRPALPPIPMDDIKPVPIAARHELDQRFSSLRAAFQEKETENNWQARERALVDVRGMLKHGVEHGYAPLFLQHVRDAQSGILKAAASLRTTLCIHAIQLIRQLALAYCVPLEACMDAFFAALLRMAGFTKRIVASASQAGVATILAYTHVRPFHWHQLQSALADKSAAARLHVVKHLELLLDMRRRAAIEAHGGVLVLGQCVQRSLCDATVEVRTNARGLFARFRTVFPEHAGDVLDALPPATRKQVLAAEKHTEPQRVRSGASSTVLAAKRAAIQAQSPARRSPAPPETPSAAGRAPRASLWHPSLSEHAPDTSGLLGASPWREERPATALCEDAEGVSRAMPLDEEARRAAQDASASASLLAGMLAMRVDESADEHGAGRAHMRDDDMRDDAAPRAPEGMPPHTWRGESEGSAHASVSSSLASAFLTPTAPASVKDAPQDPNVAVQASTHSPGHVDVSAPCLVAPPTPTRMPKADTAATRYFLSRVERQQSGPTPLGACLAHLTSHTADAHTLADLAQRCTEAQDDAWGTTSICAVLDSLATHLDTAAWFEAYTVLYHLGVYQHVRLDGYHTTYLALALRGDPDPARYTLALGASRAMLDAWAAHTEPLAACDALLAACEHVPPGSRHAHAQALSMHTLARLYAGMDVPTLRASFSRTQSAVQAALRDPDAAVRRAATDVLVEASKRVRLEELQDAFSLLTTAQWNLVQQYRARHVEDCTPRHSVRRASALRLGKLMERPSPDRELHSTASSTYPDDQPSFSLRASHADKKRAAPRESPKKSKRHAMASPKDTPRLPKGSRSDERREVRRSDARRSEEESLWVDDDQMLDDEALDEETLGADLGLDLRSLSGLFSGLSRRFHSHVTALKNSAHNRTARLVALQELCEMLSVSTEDTLLGSFPTDAIVRELLFSLGAKESEHAQVADQDAALAAVLAATGEEDGELEVYACRCLSYLLEALPQSGHVMVRHKAVPILVEKLQEITFIDLAEQVLETLERLSRTHAPAIVREGGMRAMLQYLDFFSMYVQRTAMATVANCCEDLAPSMAPRVEEIAPMIQAVLGYADAKLVEAAARAVCHIAASLSGELALERFLLQMISPLCVLLRRNIARDDGPTLGSAVYTALLHLLANAAQHSAGIAEALYENGVLDTLYSLLSGAPLDTTADATTVMHNLARRSAGEVQESLKLAANLLSPLPREGIFDKKAYTEKAYHTLARRAECEGCSVAALEPEAYRQGASQQRQQQAAAKRAAFQATWPDFYESYTRLMLPTFIEVYAASALPNVRAGILSALLRALWYASGHALETSLSAVPLASFLSGVLASREQPLLAQCALQAVELLVHKLPRIYCALLAREGALYEIEQLAEHATAPQVLWRAKLVHARLAALGADAGVEEANTQLHKLIALADTLRNVDAPAGPAALDAFASVLRSSAPVSSFELLRSGLVDAVYEFGTRKTGPMPLHERRALLAAALHTDGDAHAGYCLVQRLQESLSRLEDVHVATGRFDAPANLSQQVRIRLEADAATAVHLPRHFQSLVISMHAVATLQTLYDFLRPKLEVAMAGGHTVSGLSDVLAALAGGDLDELGAIQEDDQDGHVEDVDSGTESAGTEPSDGAETEKETRSYASAARSSKNAWHIAFSMAGHALPLDATVYACIDQHAKEQLSWSQVFTIHFSKCDGPLPAAPPQTPKREAWQSGSAVALPPCIAPNAPYARTLQLLGVLHDLSDEAMVGDGQLVLNPAAFHNNKLTAKLAQQLQEPLVVASGCVADWAHALPRTFPFLFSFDTRLAYFQSTFGYARRLHYLHKADGNMSDEVLNALAQLPRQKVRVSRTSLLSSAIKALELYGKGPFMLEVEYFDEVGSGLGPTLEFYTLVSRAFCKTDLGLWRSESADEDVDARQGLFPAPKSSEKVLSLFTSLGQFVAKSLLDGRIVDLPLNPVFVRAVLARPVPHTLKTLAQVDAALAQSLQKLRELPPAELDALSLDYAVPGGEALEGAALVTAENVGAYIAQVIDNVLDIGAQVDAFRAGFHEILSLDTLQVFTTEEVIGLVGQLAEDWSETALRRAIVPDHGFGRDSTQYHDLIAILSSFSMQERRAFLQWLTGSPRLPMGGFDGLHPALTVVRRDHETPLGPDDYLPSVMTCVNYLKLPCYTSRETMRRRLCTAMTEGLTSFHLS